MHFFLAASLVIAQTFTEPPVHVTAIELVSEVHDASGNVPADLKPEDFTVLEDGVEKPVIGVDYLGTRRAVALTPESPAEPTPPPPSPPNWQIVIYFDAFFSSTMNLRNAVASLSKQAEELAKLGTVEVVVAEPKPRVVLEATRDPEQIRQGLRKASVLGQDWLVRHRRQFVQSTELSRGPRTMSSGPSNVRGFIMEEISMTARFRRNLLEWVSRYQRHVPRALFLVSGGFELDPSRYYLSFANAADQARIREEFTAYQLGSTAEVMGKALASESWTTVAIDAPLGAGDQFLDDASRTSVGRVRALSTRPSRDASFTSQHTREPLLALADATGGTVANRAKLPEILTGLTQRVKITYQVSRPPDGRTRSVEVRSRRPGLKIRTLRWSAEMSSDEIAAARAVKLAREGEPRGELPTSVSVTWTSTEGARRKGVVTVNTNFRSIVPLLRERRGAFRVTIVALEPGAQPFVIHRIVNEYDLSTGVFTYRAPIAATDQIEVTATVEEITSGIWGGGRE